MLGLPAGTEIYKVITKKKVFEHFGAEMSTERRKSFDADIARITLTNEVSPVSVNIAMGENINSFFVLLVELKRKDFDKQNIAFLTKIFRQKLLLVLECEGKQSLSVWQTHLILGPWAAPDALKVTLDGLDLDKIWENIVANVAGVEVAQGQTLDEQLAAQQKRQKLEKEITKLEKIAWTEKQPKKKLEYKKKIEKLRCHL
ncbi:MAG: DUF4391 domain-containing protein [Clostridia bacterium]|nr:DUF4391 domain-containing protein [Clostridia bacterium]